MYKSFTRLSPEYPYDKERELIRQVKYYERLGAYAILRRDEKAAVKALMLHPLVGSYSLARQLVTSYLALNARFTGAWHG